MITRQGRLSVASDKKHGEERHGQGQNDKSTQIRSHGWGLLFVGILLCLSIARPLGVTVGTIFGGAAVVVRTVGTVWSLLAVGALSVAALVSFRALAVAALFAPGRACPRSDTPQPRRRKTAEAR